jgi:WD40 repeat protein
VALSPNEQFIVSGLRSGLLGIWATPNAALTGQIPSAYGASDIAFTPDGLRLVWTIPYRGTTRPNIGIWDTAKNQQLGQLRSADYPIAVDITADGRTMAVAGRYDGSVEIWSLDRGVVLQRFVNPSSRADDVAVSPDGKLVASACSSAAVIWDLTTGQLVRQLAINSSQGCVDFSPDGQRLVTGGGYYGEIQLWNAQDGRAVRTFRPSGAQTTTNRTQKVAFLPDPRGLVSGHYDGTIRLWRVPD